MTSTSMATIVSAHTVKVCDAEICEIALTNAVTMPTIAAQFAPFITAQPARSWTTPTIRKNHPHALRSAKSTCDDMYFEPEIAETPSMMLKKPTRNSRMPARSSQLCRSTSPWSSDGGALARGCLYQMLPDDI